MSNSIDIYRFSADILLFICNLIAEQDCFLYWCQKYVACKLLANIVSAPSPLRMIRARFQQIAHVHKLFWTKE